jgi:AcrR family transcriptional regulator
VRSSISILTVSKLTVSELDRLCQVENEIDPPAPRGPGRPLDPEVDRAILAAAGDLFVREGFQHMTLPRVAAAAGVAKTTVYRRYPSTVELVLATIDHLNTGAPAPDTGSARDDLVRVLEFARLYFDLSITGTLLTEERERPELLEAARRQMIGPAIDRFRAVLRAGIERGELHADLDIDAVAHALLGSFFIRYLELGRPGEGWSEGIVETLWPALTR